MKRIETERRKPDPENPNRLLYDGQRTAQEIFAELRYRLESTGYLPDEYFLLSQDWSNTQTWPEDGYISCSVDYGGSEGIYLDISIVYQDENNKRQTRHFATGKTLGESDSDMDRMFLIASAVTKAFHSDGVHERYVRVGETPPDLGAVISLNATEKGIVAQSLIDARFRLKEERKPFEAVEQLLRRIIGNITDYIKAVGERPMNLDDYDRATLAIADGDMEELTAILPNLPFAYGSLLTQAVARPDKTGYQMTERLCKMEANYSHDAYLLACKHAIDIGDAVRARMMITHAPQCAPDLQPGFYGDLILHAMYEDDRRGGRKGHAAELIAACCTREQIQQADPYLLKLAIMQDNHKITDMLLYCDIPVNHEPAMLMYTVAQKKDVGLAERLMQAGADINGQNHAALRACMDTGDLPSAMFLLKCGADVEGFRNTLTKGSSGSRALSDKETSFLFALSDFCNHYINTTDASPDTQAEDESELLNEPDIEFEQGDD